MTILLCSFAHNASAIATRFDDALATFGVPVRQLSSITAIVQDTFGFVWLGGENGLARYDGTEFRLFQFDPAEQGSLPNDYIWQLSIDASGYLWAATSGGLTRFNHITERFETDESLLGALSGRLVSAVAFDEKNRLYAPVTNGLYRFDLATKQVEFWEPHGEPAIATGAMYEDILLEEDGIVWLGSSGNGLTRLDTKTGTFTYFYDDGRPDALSSNRIKTLLRDSSERLWVGTFGGGINVMLPDSEHFLQLSYTSRSGSSARTASIMDITEDSQGMIWVAVDQEGVLVFNQSLELVHHFTRGSGDNGSLLSDRTRVIFEDINRDIWVGQAPFGVSFLNRGQENILTFQSDPDNPNTLSNNSILSFFESRDGTLWVGTEGGLNAFSPDTGMFKRYLSNADNPNALKASAVLALEEDSHGNLWVGTWGGGLHRFDPKKGVFYRYANNPDDPNSVGDDFIWSILQDRDGTLWIGTENKGLRRYRPETDDFSSPPTAAPGNALSNQFVLAIAEDSEGSLWIGTYDGANVYDKSTGTFHAHKKEANNAHSIASNTANSILVDTRGDIWIGGDNGVSHMKKGSDRFRRITMADGLPAQRVSSLVEDRNGDVWVATTNGVARVQPDTITIQSYSIEHGFAGSTHARDATFADSKGRLYFGSTEGVTVFYPEDLKPISSSHPIWITDFRLANRDVSVGGLNSVLQQSILTTRHLALEYHENTVSFDFVILNFRNPGKNNYAYRLDGFDSEWQYIKHRNIATYTNLDPGHYVLRVQAQAPAASWVESEQTIAIDVAPPWWHTWWAYVVYAASIAALGYVIYTIGRLKKSSDSFREQAIRDPLTGMYNRAGVQKITQWMFANPEIQNSVCVMLMDIDHFKRINDTRGHDVGDRVIKGIAHILRDTARHGDHIGRWGGEEFVLLCTSSTREGASILAKKICASVADSLFERDTQSLKVTISIGVALARADESFDQTLKRADDLLYKAKAAGRNCAILEDREVPHQ